MDLQQLATLVDLELVRVVNTLSKKSRFAKDVAEIHPDPQKLLRLHIEIARLIDGLGSKGRKLFLAEYPTWENYFDSMLQLLTAETISSERHIEKLKEEKNKKSKESASEQQNNDDGN